MYDKQDFRSQIFCITLLSLAFTWLYFELEKIPFSISQLNEDFKKNFNASQNLCTETVKKYEDGNVISSSEIEKIVKKIDSRLAAVRCNVESENQNIHSIDILDIISLEKIDNSLIEIRRHKVVFEVKLLKELFSQFSDENNQKEQIVDVKSFPMLIDEFLSIKRKKLSEDKKEKFKIEIFGKKLFQIHFNENQEDNIIFDVVEKQILSGLWEEAVNSMHNAKNSNVKVFENWLRDVQISIDLESKLDYYRAFALHKLHK